MGVFVPAPTVRTVDLAGDATLPMLLVGPSLGTSVTALWGECAALLGDRFHVVGWDLPGHGVSPAPPAGDGLTVDALAAEVHAAANAVLHRRGEPGGRYAYAGDSVGGAVGLQLMLDHPDAVVASVLLCTGARIGDEAGWRARAELVGAEGTDAVLEQSAARWFAPGFPDRAPASTERLLDSLRATDRHGYAAVCGALAGFDVRARLGEIVVPVLAVAGREDAPTPPELLEQLAAGLRDGCLVVLDGVAHLAPAEAPAPVAELVADHVRRAGAVAQSHGTRSR